MFVERDDTKELYLFDEESFEAFMKRETVTIHTFIKPYSNDQVWTEFFEKYLLMSREQLTTCLRNVPRQHRNAKRYFKDLAILTSEATFTDETIHVDNNIQLQKHNTVAILLSLRLTLTAMTRYLSQIF